jgi:putative AdoMet-dependent methyltransferase
MNESRKELFDNWAEGYDASIQGEDTFPFAGYEEVLQEIVRRAAPEPGMRVLDVGTGTGNLAAVFLDRGCDVWGLDFSKKMLEKAAEKYPQAHFVEVDLRDDLLNAFPHPFDRIVSAYALHEFDLPTKVNVLGRLVADHLAPGGYVVVGDVAFPSAKAHEVAHQRWEALWDEEEHYWVASQARIALLSVGLEVEYSQLSCCGGVFRIRKG